MSKFVCDKCEMELSSHPALYRHKLHSCKKNPYKTPRKDKIERDLLKANSSATSMVCINSSKPVDCEETALVPINKSDIMSMFMQNDPPSIQETSDVEEDSGSMGDILKKILDNQTALATSQKNLEKRLDNPTDIKNPNNPQYINIDKIQIYLTEPVDFVDVLEKRMGDRKKAIDFVRSKVNKKTEGDVDLFCEIYLHGEPDTWSVACPDKKNHIYHILKPNNEGIISDPGGSELYKIFRSNYTNTLLTLSNTYIKETLSLNIDSKEYEKARDELLDVFDLGSIQEKVCMLSTAPCNPFIKKLSVKFKMLEKSFELLAKTININTSA